MTEQSLAQSLRSSRRAVGDTGQTAIPAACGGKKNACGARLLITSTPTGRTVALDWEPTPDGGWTVTSWAPDRIARPVEDGEQPRWRWTAHELTHVTGSHGDGQADG